MALWWGRSFEGGAMTNASAPRWPNHLNPGGSVATLKFDAALGLRAGPAGDLPWWRQSKREDAPSYTGQQGEKGGGFFMGQVVRCAAIVNGTKVGKSDWCPDLRVFVSELFILLIFPTPWIGHIFIGCLEGATWIMNDHENGGKKPSWYHACDEIITQKTHRKNHLPGVNVFSSLAA